MRKKVFRSSKIHNILSRFVNRLGCSVRFFQKRTNHKHIFLKNFNNEQIITNQPLGELSSSSTSWRRCLRPCMWVRRTATTCTGRWSGVTSTCTQAPGARSQLSWRTWRPSGVTWSTSSWRSRWKTSRWAGPLAVRLVSYAGPFLDKHPSNNNSSVWGVHSSLFVRKKSMTMWD